MNYWSWKGKYIGYKISDYLFSRNGNPVGYFIDDELYSFDGHYIAEVMNNDRLIVCKSKKMKNGSRCIRPCNYAGRSYCDYVGYAMLAGYEDFEMTI